MSQTPETESKEYPLTLHGYEATTIEGKKMSMADFKGKVLLIVNTASKCGFSSQLMKLEELFNIYKEKGLVVLGFPSDSFHQEPLSNSEIGRLCGKEQKITFPMFEKTEVKGKDKHPLFEWLTDRTANPDWGGKIGWNFTKFLISREGTVIDRFSSKDEPLSETVTEAIEQALDENPIQDI